MTDPIADMLIRIKNAQAVGHPAVRVPFSKLKLNLARILEREGFIGNFEDKGKDVKKYIKINLKYQESTPVISGVKKVSKPGQRIYAKKDGIKRIKQGRGVAVVSTSRGLMTDKEARTNKIGGEIICEIW